MKKLHRFTAALLIPTLLFSGCCFGRGESECRSCPPIPAPLTPSPGDQQLILEEPLLEPCDEPGLPAEYSPDDLPDLSDENTYWNVSLQECIEYALKNSEVMRNLGGTILTSTASNRTVFDPAITYVDPRFGEEAALSAFDANWNSSAYIERNDRLFNNNLIGNNGILNQELFDASTQLQKRNALGTIMTIRGSVLNDVNNSIGNSIGKPPGSSAVIMSGGWDMFTDFEMRQPLLQGGGMTFNRIAGPSTEPGVINGVLVARVRTDISLADFETGVRSLISDVENAFWDLHYCYLDFESRIRARDRALELLASVQAKRLTAMKSASDEAQAKEQFYRFQADALDSLNGRLIDATRSFNGTTGGTFRSLGGVRVAERRLRLMIGMPINDMHLLRPKDQTLEMPIKFDWNLATDEAVTLRPELRRQRWTIKQRELELLAARNFLLPRLDLAARYRFRGFGDNLLGARAVPDNISSAPDRTEVLNGTAAFADLLGGDRQEWQMGVEFGMPIGFRRAHAGVRQAELNLSREVAFLQEQKRQVLFGLSNAIAEVRRAYDARSIQINRYNAAKQQVESLEALRLQDRTTMDVVLEAERRLVETELALARANVEYTIAVRNVHIEKGTYLEYCNVMMSESSSPGKAYHDAMTLRSRRSSSLDYQCNDVLLSRGLSSQPYAGIQSIQAGADTNQGVPTLAVPPTASSPTQFEAVPGNATESTKSSDGLNHSSEKPAESKKIEQEEKLPMPENNNISSAQRPKSSSAVETVVMQPSAAVDPTLANDRLRPKHTFRPLNQLRPGMDSSLQVEPLTVAPAEMIETVGYELDDLLPAAYQPNRPGGTSISLSDALFSSSAPSSSKPRFAPLAPVTQKESDESATIQLATPVTSAE